MGLWVYEGPLKYRGYGTWPHFSSMSHPPVLEIKLSASASRGQKPYDTVIRYKFNQHQFERTTLFAYRPVIGCKIQSSGVIKTPDDRLIPLWSDVEVDVSPNDGETESGKKTSARRINIHEYVQAVLLFKFINRGTTLTSFDFDIRDSIYQLDELVAYAQKQKLRAEAIRVEKIRREKMYTKKMHLQNMTEILKRRKFYSDLSAATACLETWLHQRSEQKNSKGVMADEDEEIPSDVLAALDRAHEDENALYSNLAQEYADF